MKSHLLIVLLFIGCNPFLGVAQTVPNFKPGYLVTTSGEKIDGYINIYGWPEIPSVIDYRFNEEDASKNISREDIAEISITGLYKHVRATVGIDRSTRQIDRLNYDKEVHLQDENLLLEVLVEGNASLYYYEEFDLRRMFYSVEGSPIQQLVYKLYWKEGDNLGENLTYKQQLWDDLKCDDIKITDLNDLDYQNRQILKFFLKYNDCKGEGQEVFSEIVRKSDFRVSLFSGVHLGRFKHELLDPNDRFNFDKKIRFSDFSLGNGVGFEFEYFLPSNNKEFSLLFSPYFLRTNSSVDNPPISTNLKLRTINMLFGVRYNLNKDDFRKGFLELSTVMGVNAGSRFIINDERDAFANSRMRLSIGGGLNIGKNLYTKFTVVTPSTVSIPSGGEIIQYGQMIIGVGYYLQKK